LSWQEELRVDHEYLDGASEFDLQWIGIAPLESKFWSLHNCDADAGIFGVPCCLFRAYACTRITAENGTESSSPEARLMNKTVCFGRLPRLNNTVVVVDINLILGYLAIVR
jgi:hypothetical protein